MTPPIGIYVRVSRRGDREDDRFHSPREQAERSESLARAQGFTPGPVFEDINVSGATPPAERPAMGRLLTAIDAGELGGIAAYSLDRLSRDPAHGDELVRRVTRAGGVLLTPDMPEAIDSPTGEFTFGMLLQVARLYRRVAGQRFHTAKERAILAGIPVGSPPIGYRVGADRRLELDPESAPLVRTLFERRSWGETYTPLANFLRDETGHSWTLSGVARILRNHLYATGRLEYGPELVSEHAAEAIIDEALWHAVQAVTPRPRPPRSADAGWLLTGLVRCAACGKALSCHLSGTGSKYRRYRCRNRACPARANVTAVDIERLALLQAVAVGGELATRANAPDLGALEDAVAVAERRLAQVLTPETQDAMGDTWTATVKARRTERDAALTALGEGRGAAVLPARLLHPEEVWDDLSPLERRDVMGLYWKVIRVARGGGVTFVARGPHGESQVVLPTNDEGPQ